jgi:hypothetical protein
MWFSSYMLTDIRTREANERIFFRKISLRPRQKVQVAFELFDCIVSPWLADIRSKLMS